MRIPYLYLKGPAILRLVTGLFLVSLLGSPAATSQDSPKNVILMIADGFGPASVTMARDFVRATEGRSQLAMDLYLVGSSRTYSTSSRVTDSAAGATAFACGIKSYNGAIAVDSSGVACATILEAAEARGMATGLVATSRITHATPASFSAHVKQRAQEEEIASQQMAMGMEVILGGGSKFFLPVSEGGSRKDERNLFREAQELGYTVVRDRSGFDSNGTGPVLGLFADDHLDYEIDRIATEQPSLLEMTQKALDILSADPDGFFLMIEGSRIDHAAHGNDPVGHIHDILAYDETLAAVMAFAEDNGETLVVSTADHETGGLSLGRNNASGSGIYEWHPDILATYSASREFIEKKLDEGMSGLDVAEQVTGLADLTDDERTLLTDTTAERSSGATSGMIMEMINRRVSIDWGTTGHTAVDVGIYATGPGSDLFVRNMDNNEIGLVIIWLMSFDMSAVKIGGK